MELKILDCTLRDGGYYTNWDFDRALVDTYLDTFNKLPVEYLEVGYRSPIQQGYLGEYFYCPIYVLERLKLISNKKLVIILNEKDVNSGDAEALLSPCLGLIDMIRLAVDPENFERALELGRAVKALGFDLCFNVMYMSNWSDYPALMENLHQLEGMANYLYMVDSYGGVYPDDVIRIIKEIRSRTTISLGFHGHNNLELGLINTLTAIDYGVEIVDATITGMGRGAGNLKMELLLTALNAKKELNVDFNALSNVVVAFEQLQASYQWGTNLPYMVSGANSLPQKDVMEWVTKRFYSINSIIRALQNQKDKRADNEKLSIFKETEAYLTVLIIGGGPSARIHAEAIMHFIEQQDNLGLIHASSKNASHYQHLRIPQYYCLVGNEGHRLEKTFTETISDFPGKCVLPPFPRKMGTYIPSSLKEKTFELAEITFTDKIKDSHTVLALQAALEIGAKHIYIVGYDGYQGQMMTPLERSLAAENEALFQDFKIATNLSLISLLPTEYSELESESIFAKL